MSSTNTSLQPTSFLSEKPGGYLITPEGHCYVCKREFAKDPSLRPHSHHIIPRAYGGTDGPMARLCTGHHDLVHAVALKLISGGSYFNLTKGMPEEELLRLLWLSSRVQAAHAELSNDPSKKVLFTASWNKSTHQKLKELATLHKTNKANLLLSLIDRAYESSFPSKKIL